MQSRHQSLHRWWKLPANALMETPAETRHRPTDKRSGAACAQPLVHLSKIRPVNRCLRCRDRVALRFWRSRPGCDCEDRPNRNKNPEDKSERFSSHVSLLIQEVGVDTN